MNLGPLPQLRCLSTCVDNSLRGALALRNRNNIELRSCLHLCLCLCTGSHWILYLCHRTNQVCCPWSLCCLPSFLHRPCGLSRIHQLLLLDTTFPAPWSASYPFHAIAHTSSYDMLNVGEVLPQGLFLRSRVQMHGGPSKNSLLLFRVKFHGGVRPETIENPMMFGFCGSRCIQVRFLSLSKNRFVFVLRVKKHGVTEQKQNCFSKGFWKAGPVFLSRIGEKKPRNAPLHVTCVSDVQLRTFHRARNIEPLLMPMRAILHFLTGGRTCYHFKPWSSR